jgi:hypothetical protein|uniref:Uncharacterized protein n=1 Tax=viral metagenome TaxID=1070528 RepID=A0A6C0BEQ4_9ZZZZ
MALTLINAVVSKAIFETQLETLETLRKFLADKEDVDVDFMNELLDEFKSKVESDYKPPKGAAKALKEASGKNSKKSDSDSENKPKKKSAYTLFIQYKMKDADFKASQPDLKKGKDLMAAAVASWSELSDDIKNKMKTLNKENPDLTGEELFKQCAKADKKDKPKPAAKATKKEKPVEESDAESDVADSDAE